MSEEAKNTKLSRSEEIAELKRQMEQMSKRLEELSAQEAENGSENAVLPEGEVLNATGDAGEGTCAVSNRAEASKAGLLREAGEDAAAVQFSEAQNAQPVVPAQPFQKGPVVAQGDVSERQAAAQPEKSKGEKASACGPIEKEPEFDAAYVAAAVEDFMPQSKPPQPAPPLQDAPGGPYSAAQRENKRSQPYAQQPGQAAYYQNAGASQGGYQGQYQQSYTPAKDHVAAGLLAIFLGVFGVHKFYLGYNTAGFILLGVTILGGIFTFGIAASVVWLIGLIEGVIYLTKSQTEFNQIYVYGKRDWF